MNANWTRDHRRDLAEMFESGWTDDEIAAEMGRSVSSVRYGRRSIGLVRKYGRPYGTHSPGPRANQTWTDEEDAKIRELVTAGLTTDQMAPLLGRSYSAVKERRRKIGLGAGRGNKVRKEALEEERRHE